MNNIEKLKNIFKEARQFLVPPPILTAVEWSERNLIVIDGPMAGQKLKLFSFQKEMLNAIHEGKKKIVYKTSAQISKTTLLNCILFYQMKHSGHNIGVLQSTTKELGQWISGKIKPAIQQTPALAELITSKSDKDAVNNQAQIQLRDGTFIYCMSLTSPSHLRGKTLATAILDEVDAAQESPEGDPVLLAEQRVTTFQDEALVLISSTPTVKEGAINKQFDQSDQRYFYVPCQHCQHEQILKWENVKFDKGIRQGKQIPLPDTARYVCPHCEKAWTEGDRLRAVAKGKFIAHNPGAASIGFHVSRLYSPLSTIVSCVQDYADAFQSFSLGTWFNTCLGVTFDDLNDDCGTDELEKLKADINLESIPNDAVFLVAGIDQQKDRLECCTLAVAPNALYLVDYRMFYDLDCEKRDSKAYTNLIEYLKSDFRTASGDKIPMHMAFLDSGNGKATQVVYANCNRLGKLKAIKGSSSFNAPVIPVQPSKTGGQELYVLGVNAGKSMVRELINRNLKGDAPTTLQISNDVPDDWSEQILSEELKRSGNTVRWMLKKGSTRNEALDTFVYALAAMQQVLKLSNWQSLRKIKAKRNVIAPIEDITPPKAVHREIEAMTNHDKEPETEKPKKGNRARQKPRSSWMNF